MPTVEERVARGVDWLDANRAGWVDEIDLDALDIRSACRCVLGQLYRDFYHAPEPVKATATPMGFDTRTDLTGARTDPTGIDSIERDSTALEAEWRRVITSRRAAA